MLDEGAEGCVIVDAVEEPNSEDRSVLGMVLDVALGSRLELSMSEDIIEVAGSIDVPEDMAVEEPPA